MHNIIDVILEWFPTSLGSAHAVLQYNIAVAKTIRGQLDQASALLKQVWSMNKSCRVPAHIIMLVIYIELKLGKKLLNLDIHILLIFKIFRTR